MIPAHLQDLQRLRHLQQRLVLAVLLTGVLMAAASTASAQHSYPKPQIASAAGQPAPNFTLSDQDGKPVELAALKGQPVLLYFYRGYW